MKWIIGAGKDIIVDKSQLSARTDYIRRVTKAEVSTWGPIHIVGNITPRFYACESNEGVDGVFITAHIGDIYSLFALRQVYRSEMIVVNTCIWKKLTHKGLKHHLLSRKSIAELYFSKQELSLDVNHLFRQTTTIVNVGQFGFQTSVSERELFINRNLGLEKAIKQSFERVSPIIFPGE